MVVLVGREAGDALELRARLHTALGRDLTGRRLRALLDFDAAGPAPAHAPELGPCLPFTGALGESGYGVFWTGPNRTRAAHRVAWEALFGPVPDAMHLDHYCHDWQTCPPGACPHRVCGHPGHLQVLTPAANMARSNAPAAVNARKLWCDATPAHPLWPGHPNVYLHPSRGTRHCRACQLIRAQAWAARQRAAAAAAGKASAGSAVAGGTTSSRRRRG